MLLYYWNNSNINHTLWMTENWSNLSQTDVYNSKRKSNAISGEHISVMTKGFFLFKIAQINFMWQIYVFISYFLQKINYRNCLLQLGIQFKILCICFFGLFQINKNTVKNRIFDILNMTDLLWDIYIWHRDDVCNAFPTFHVQLINKFVLSLCDTIYSIFIVERL